MQDGPRLRKRPPRTKHGTVYRILTIDLEDYRRQELRDHRGKSEPAHPDEVERQLNGLLGLLESIGARATFFSVGRLAKELAPWAWRETAIRHTIGAMGTSISRWKPLGLNVSSATCVPRRRLSKM